MEYKINQYNLSDINFQDLLELKRCFENSLSSSNISYCVLGTNLLQLLGPEGKISKTNEDKKIISTYSNLFSYSLNSTGSVTNLNYSLSNANNKIYLKRFLSNFKSNFQKNDLKEILDFYKLVSFFTNIKDDYGDELPITDYELRFNIKNNFIKLNKINPIQFNYEFIIQNIKADNSNANYNKSNINFFYMLLYNLSINELYEYLYCNQTQNYFEVFNSKTNDEDFYKRYIFINQFKLLRNESSYRNIMKNKKENIVNIVKEEYKYFQNLYKKFLEISEMFLIDKEKIKFFSSYYLAIILLSEYDINQDNVIINLIQEFSENNILVNNKDIFTYINNFLIDNENFNYLKENDSCLEEKMKNQHILSKLSVCLNIAEYKIVYLLIYDILQNFNVNNNIQGIIDVNIMQLIIILYLITVDKILTIFNDYELKKTINPDLNISNKKDFSMYFLRPNLIFNYITNENKCISKNINNIYLNINKSNEHTEENIYTYIINDNIVTNIKNNYYQELKNVILLKNSLNNNPHCFSKNPKIKSNSDFLNRLYNSTYNYQDILNLYENNICGLFKLISDEKKFYNKNNINYFKVQFNKNIMRKNKIELIDLLNAIANKNETFIKVTHSFGIILYNLNNLLFHLDEGTTSYNTLKPSPQKETTIYKVLDKKLYNYRSLYYKYYDNLSLSIFKKLYDNTNANTNNKIQITFISFLIELNKYDTLTLFDDLKLNIIYAYYSNYYNYIINIFDIRNILSKAFPRNNNTNKDFVSFFNFISKKIKITKNDFIFSNNNDNNMPNYVFIKNKLSSLFSNEKNISLLLYKYNYQKFVEFFCDSVLKSKFHYFKYIINGVRTFLRLTKIYKVKLTISNVRNLLTDIISDNYDISNNEKSLQKLDNLEELVFDFNRETLGKMLPKLRANLIQFSKIWYEFISDIKYLLKNRKFFSNKDCTDLIIEQKIVNLLIIIFLLNKKYLFINEESVKQYGVLVTEFTKTMSSDVLIILNDLRERIFDFLQKDTEFYEVLQKYGGELENITFQKLISKRIELNEIINKKLKEKEKNNNLEMKNIGKLREKNKSKIKNEKNNNDLNNNNATNELLKGFNLPIKELIDGKISNDSNRDSLSKKIPSMEKINSFRTLRKNSSDTSNELQINKSNNFSLLHNIASNKNISPSNNINSNSSKNGKPNSNSIKKFINSNKVKKSDMQPNIESNYLSFKNPEYASDNNNIDNYDISLLSNSKLFPLYETYSDINDQATIYSSNKKYLTYPGEQTNTIRLVCKQPSRKTRENLLNNLNKKKLVKNKRNYNFVTIKDIKNPVNNNIVNNVNTLKNKNTKNSVEKNNIEDNNKNNNFNKNKTDGKKNNNISNKFNYINNGLASTLINELDKKIEKLRNEINNIDIMDSFSEENCLKPNKNKNEIYNEVKELNKGYYDNINDKLNLAEEYLDKLLKD